MGFLHRHPYATDAYELGYAVGHREDYEYLTRDYPNVDLPTIILDNDFRDPDIGRYLDQFDTYDPSVAILGDAYTPAEAEGFNAVVEQLRDEFSHKEYVVVPKCGRAFDILDRDTVLGYPMGYSDVEADDYSEREDWRGRKVHLLGASPPKQYAVMQELTQPNLRDDPPANIVGVDWNGPHKMAYLGEYWSRDGWQPADHLSIRNTVRKSLEEIKQYWQDRGVWPETEPIDLYGPAVEEPNELIYMDQGGDPIGTREDLEAAYVERYEEYGRIAFLSEHAKKRWEYYEGLTLAD
ncbi:DUF6610 family protein [Halanaeroarchaeum sulfurireducens]|uniref:DUF6610 family protein n=1 Tax=Halanaeroarchaeum sulfurireducens TaxID=1604004 RepID=UPI002E0E3FD1